MLFRSPDGLGGRFSMSTSAFNVMRNSGTTTRRAALTMDWERPFTGMLGDLWKIKLHNDAIGYDAYNFNQQPNFATTSRINDARATADRLGLGAGRLRTSADVGAARGRM